MGMRHDSQWRIPPIGFFLVEMRARPQPPWLREVESYLTDLGMTGQASAREMAMTEAEEEPSQMDAATRYSSVCHHN